MEQHDFVKGALVGSLVGGLCALFLAPKSGKQLCCDIADTYNSLNEQTHSYADDIKDKASYFYDKIRGIEHHEEPSHPFLIGGLSGAILGALAAALMAPNSGSKLREKLGDQYDEIYDKAKGAYDQIQKKGKNIESSLEDWKDVLSSLIEKLSGSASSKKGQSNSYLNEVFYWASLAMRLYNQTKARR